MALRIARVFRGRAFAIYDCSCRVGDGDSSPDEYVSDDQIVFVREGHFVRRVGSRRTAHEPGTAVIFRRGESHRFDHPCVKGDRCAVFVLSPDTDHPSRGDDRRPRESPPPTSQRSALLLARLSMAARSNPPVDALALEEAGLALLDAFARDTATETTSRAPSLRASHRRLARAARDILATRFREHDDVSALATRLCCSPFHLCRVFKATTGRTLTQYRTRLRLLASLSALETGVTDLTALALELGFADHSHLTNSFRAAFGRPPSALRKPPTRDELRDLSNRLQVEVDSDP